MTDALMLIIGLVVGAGGTFLFTALAGKSALTRAHSEADQIRENAKLEAANKAKEIELAAKQQQLKLKEKFERENEGSRKKLEEQESRLTKREDTLDRKLDTLVGQGKDSRRPGSQGRRCAKSRSQIKEQQLDDMLKEQRERLLQITNMSPDQAKEMLLKRIEDECRQRCRRDRSRR